MAHTQAGAHTPSAAHAHHVIPIALLLKVFGGLIFLTIFTVFSAQFDLGWFTVPLALLIASTKAFLVVAFFMGLKYDNRVNTLAFAVSIIFVIVFVVFTLFDTAFRGDMANVDAQTIMDIDRGAERLQAAEPDPATQRIPMGTFEQDSLALRPGAAAPATPATPADTTAAPAPPADTTAAEAAPGE